VAEEVRNIEIRSAKAANFEQRAGPATEKRILLDEGSPSGDYFSEFGG
jgi:hypothetical protein